MQRDWFYFSWLVMGSCFLVGCQTPSRQERPTTPTPASSRAEWHGIALLYELLGQEKDVSKLLLIKRDRTELNTLVKEVSRVCGDAHKRIESWAKGDNPVNLLDQGLPNAEMETRKAISKTKGKELLTGKGAEFELRLLLSQNEALTYGSHLALVAAQHERQQDRTQYLLQLSQDLRNLQQGVVGMMEAYYRWPGLK
jgi:hypothetical protein